MKAFYLAVLTTAVFAGCEHTEPETISDDQPIAPVDQIEPPINPFEFSAAGPPDSGSDAGASQKPEIDIITSAVTGNVDAIRQQAAAGSDFNQKDANGSTPLVVAATFGQTASITALLEGGADVNLQDNNGSTPLHAAAFMCHKEAVTILLDAKADRSVKNNQGSTALDTVVGPFEEVRGVYDFLKQLLGPAGLEVDYEYLAATRPEIAKMLR